VAVSTSSRNWRYQALGPTADPYRRLWPKTWFRPSSVAREGRCPTVRCGRWWVNSRYFICGRTTSERRGVPQRLIVVAFVTSEALDFLGVAQHHPTAHLCIVRAVCRTVKAKNGPRVRIDQPRRFQRLYVAIRPVDVMAGCRLPVEECGIHGPWWPGSQAAAERAISWRQKRVGTRSNDRHSVEGVGNSLRTNCKTA